MYSILWHFLNKDESDDAQAYLDHKSHKNVSTFNHRKSNQNLAGDKESNKNINIYKYNQDQLDD